ncbi:MAG: hypothetical protein KatS3mg110_4089 [Pirellulaceae bacterium]|nr:MAG: hypothetical protein KatS3mg110_4089 [Pirellulaceae bacterium]
MNVLTGGMPASTTGGLLVFGEVETVYYRFNRLEALSEGWHWLVLFAVLAALIAFVVRLYVKDTVELRRPLALALVVLRLSALAGVLFYFLDLEKGTERTLTINSRAILLMDISQSMAQADVPSSSGQPVSRSEAVVEALEQHQFLDRLRQQHDVQLLSIGDSERPVPLAAFAKKTVGRGIQRQESRSDAWPLAVWVARIGLGLLIVGLASAVLAMTIAFAGRWAAGEPASWPALVAVVLSLSGLVLLATAHLRTSHVPLAALLQGNQQAPEDARRPENAADRSEEEPRVDWRELLAPRAQETRLGDALQQTVMEQRGGPVAGIVVISDGQTNAGLAPHLAAVSAQEAGIVVHTVAVGSDRPPTNVRVVDVEAPLRVYPGDRFELKAYIQAYQMEGRSLDVRLLSAAATNQAAPTLEDQKTVRLGPDGTTATVEYQVTPPELGKRVYTVEVAAPPDDRQPQDNSKSTTVDVLEQRTRVLIVAGGPTREYQFVRNLLYRDRDVITAVWLQSGEPGISQEGDELLFEFPRTWQEMSSYDCVLAFDPDWLQLDDDQVRLLERWVSEDAGGLLVVGGAIYTPEWTRLRRGSDPRADLLKALYPVVFPTESSSRLDFASAGSDQPWPLELTRDGLSEKFLWLDDDPLRSEAIWASFSGVYGYLPVRELKKGARAYAYLSDPSDSSLDDRPAIYWASHYYGSGRVFFAASGEMWRLRALDEGHFNRFYTKLVRWLAQGRLSRGSRHGLLLADKERCSIGDQVVVTAILTDLERKPLQVPTVDASLVAPDGSRQPLVLRRLEHASREGEYQAQFAARQEGDYRVEVVLPQSTEEPLAVEVRCSGSAVETRTVTRNDAVMREIAERTGGKFFTNLAEALGPGSADHPSLVELLVPQDQEARLPGTPDRQFKERLHAWLMALVAGALCLEWTLRRLNRLA